MQPRNGRWTCQWVHWLDLMPGLRWIHLPCLLAAAFVPAHAPAQPQSESIETQPQATYSLINTHDPVLLLHGSFRFHPGDDPAWSKSDLNDSDWPLVASDRSWAQSGYKKLSGVAWYRFTLALPPGSETFALRLPQIRDSYELFLDGSLVSSQGVLPPHPVTYFTQPALIVLPTKTRLTPTVLHLAIRVWISAETASYANGGMQGHIEVAPQQLLSDDFRASQIATKAASRSGLDLGLLELVASLTSISLFILNRSEAEYLWFSLLALGLAGQNIVAFWATGRVAPVFLTETVLLLWLRCFQVSFLLFLRKLLNARWTLALRVTLSCVGLALTCDLLWGLPHVIGTTVGNLIDNFFDLPVFLWSLVIVVQRTWRRSPDARWLAAPVLLLIFTQQFSAVATTLEVSAHPALARWAEQHLAIKEPIDVDYTQLAEAIFLLAMLAILIHRFARTLREQDRTHTEFEAAREVQQIMVPHHLPETPGLRIQTAYHPAQEVGGDFFQVLALRESATLLVIGDVAGKGLPAALTVSLAIGSLRTLAESAVSPAAILMGLNRRLHGRSVGFTTCLALLFEPGNGNGLCTLTVANAGHLPPYLNGAELPTDASLPLGLDEDAVFTETTHFLVSEDHLAMLTDGIPEAMQSGKLLGFERTAELSQASSEEIAEAARLFGQVDDITVLTVDVLGSTS